MTEEETQKLEARLLDAVTVTITKVVNGKIDRQHQILERQNEVMAGLIKKVDDYQITHESDMAEIKPFVQMYAGSKIIGSFATWIGKLAFWVLGFCVTLLTYKQLIK